MGQDSEGNEHLEGSERDLLQAEVGEPRTPQSSAFTTRHLHGLRLPRLPRDPRPADKRSQPTWRGHGGIQPQLCLSAPSPPAHLRSQQGGLPMAGGGPAICRVLRVSRLPKQTHVRGYTTCSASLKRPPPGPGVAGVRLRLPLPRLGSGHGGQLLPWTLWGGWVLSFSRFGARTAPNSTWAAPSTPLPLSPRRERPMLIEGSRTPHHHQGSGSEGLAHPASAPTAFFSVYLFSPPAFPEPPAWQPLDSGQRERGSRWSPGPSH